ncbi:hypothetical protein OIDMADRAFT_61155 [Oidiodendron maius Zn]|uniref:Uncharacterized protein n=1 Tax=Oidiodendron maius (strain Zn) TaxID=913774 RepID=A0A0C3C4Q3_OIDMZ|nr:hypothetical protein OIDMADRAFT_61155 [Oidiodendron maius Zn]
MNIVGPVGTRGLQESRIQLYFLVLVILSYDYKLRPVSNLNRYNRLIGIVKHAIPEIAAGAIEAGTTAAEAGSAAADGAAEAALGAARVASTAGKVGQAASNAVEVGQAASNVAEAGQTPEKAGQAVKPNAKTAEPVAKGNTNSGRKVSSPLKKAGKEVIKQATNNQQTTEQSPQNQPTNPQQNQGTQQLKQQPLKGGNTAHAANNGKLEAGKEKPENRKKLEGANRGMAEATGGGKEKIRNGGDNAKQKNAAIKSGGNNAEPKKAPPKEAKPKSSRDKKNGKRQDPGSNIHTYARPVMYDDLYIGPAAFPPQYPRYAQNLFSSTFLCLVGQQAPLAHHYEGNALVLQGLAEPCLQMMELWNGTTIEGVYGTIQVDCSKLYFQKVTDTVRVRIPTVATAGL